MTAKRAAKGLVVLVLGIAWVTAALLLWQDKVPGGLHLSGLDEHRFFGDGILDRTSTYERFTTWNQVLSLVALLAVLAAYARWGARWMQESLAGPIGTGMMLGMLGLAFVWIAQVPFTIAQLWWDRRYGLSDAGYLEYLTQGWLGLVGTFVFISFALFVVMGLARFLGNRWWIAAAPVFVGLALLFAFISPWLLTGQHGLRDPYLAEQARVLEQREGAAPTRVTVQDVSEFTNAPNAVTTGLGPSRRIVVWDTLLDGRFTDREVRVVLAHEIGHVARSHIWKSVGWFALLAIPGAYLISLATRRRGGMANPEAVPLSLFVLVALNLLALPLQNIVTRHMEAEADWLALQGARDPAAQRSLFQAFAMTSLEDPDPGVVDYVLFENHPTLMQRIAMVEDWRERYATSTAQSP